MNISWSQTLPSVLASCYSTPQYLRLFSAYEGSSYRYLTINRDNSLSCLPLLVRQISDQKYEAASPYGYGGFLGSLAPFDHDDVCRIQLFLKKSNIVSLFIRHSPFTSNHEILPSSFLELNRHTYVQSLGHNLSDSNHRSAKVRSSIKRAIQSGYTVSFADANSISTSAIQQFSSVYLDRMECIAASNFYRFPTSFFLQHFRSLPSITYLARVSASLTGSDVGGAIFLVEPSTGRAHYHLSALTPQAMTDQVIHLLLSASANFFSNRGFRQLFLGGGHSLSQTDGLSRLKQKHSDSVLPFYVSKIICDDTSYFDLRKQNHLTEHPYFLISDALAN